MYFDIEALDGPRSYKLLTSTVVPRPIAWVVTLDPQGTPNAAPFSFFNFFAGFPPIVCLGIGQRRGDDGRPRAKDTLRHIEARGEFVVNAVSEALVEAMNLTAAEFPPGCDELAAAGLATAPSTKVGTPRIAASPVALECRLQQVLPIDGGAHIVVARVLAMHVDDAAVTDVDRCRIDSGRLKLVGRMQSPGRYARTSDGFRLDPVDHARWQAEAARDGGAGPGPENLTRSR